MRPEELSRYPAQISVDRDVSLWNKGLSKVVWCASGVIALKPQEVTILGPPTVYTFVYSYCHPKLQGVLSASSIPEVQLP